ncbi:MAG: hypothetical protein NXI08_01715 [bacterium]|nr:hypothetical protein [bacterium]
MKILLLSLSLLFFGIQQVHAQSISDSTTASIFSSKALFQSDVLRALSGLSPGLIIHSTGGVSGTGTNPVFRSYSSLNTPSNPLIIVDGIRFDGANNHNSSAFNGGGSLVTPNRSFDLHPSEIVSVNVLSSLEGTFLYGEEATNGVIEITTRRNAIDLTREGYELTIDQSVYSTSMSSRPDYQNQFGMGFNGQYGPFFSSWGASFDSRDPADFPSNFNGLDNDGAVLVDHPYGFYNFTSDDAPDYATEVYRYEARETPTDAYFRNGIGSRSFIDLNYRKGSTSWSFNYAGNQEEGFTPNNAFLKNSFGSSVKYQLLDNVQGTSSLQFLFTDVKMPPLSAGSGSGVVEGGATTGAFTYLFFTPRSIDLALPSSSPDNNGFTYYRPDIIHPVWFANNASTTNETNRILGKTALLFNPSDRFQFNYTYTFDSYDENQEYKLNPTGTFNFPYVLGLYQTIEIDRTLLDNFALATYRPNLGNRLFAEVRLGGHYMSENINEKGLESTDIREYGVFEHDNFRVQSSTNSFTNELMEREFERRSFGAFGSMELELDRWIYTDVGVRRQWNQSLHQQDMNAVYPYVTFGVIPSKVLVDNDEILSNLDFSFSYFTSGRSILTELEILVQDRPSVGLNDELKPERSIEKQVAATLGLFKDRISFSGKYYQRIHTDLISRIAVNPTQGFGSILDNLLEMEVEGFDAQAVLVPLKGKVNWKIISNFSTTKADVKEYTGTFNAIQLGNSQSFRGNLAQVNEPYLSMYGSTVLRVTSDIQRADPNMRSVPIGTPIIDNNGNYLTDQNDIIGNPIPDWNLSTLQQVRYKNLSFSIQIDYQKGGDMYSSWISSLVGRGLISSTLDREETFIIEGVKFDGTPNDIEISKQQYYFSNLGFGPDELRVYDMTHLRISHIGFSYQIPHQWITKTGLKEVIISFSVENAFLKMYNIPEGTGFDPNVNSNGAGLNNLGFEYLTGPGARRFGGSLRVRI